MTGGSARRERGQSTLDFAVGISLFLLAVTFTFAFVPGLTQPFSDTARVTPATADRIADRLVGDDLAEPGRPYLLDVPCTAAFFDATTDDTGCSFDDGEPLADRLGLPESDAAISPHVRVALYENAPGEDDLLCWDDDAGSVYPDDPTDPTDCAESLSISTGVGSPATAGSVVVARRSVSIDGEDAILRVSVW